MEQILSMLNLLFSVRAVAFGVKEHFLRTTVALL